MFMMAPLNVVGRPLARHSQHCRREFAAPEEVWRYIADDGGPIRLLTMPRILGYSFNPLSLYFCYACDGALRAILYEVNNTFGQRHSYFLPVETAAGAPIRSGANVRSARPASGAKSSMESRVGANCLTAPCPTTAKSSAPCNAPGSGFSP